MQVRHLTSPRLGAFAAGLLLAAIPGLAGSAAAAVRIEGQVQAGSGAVSGSTVSLWAASADAPRRLAQAQTDADGRFVVSVDQTPIDIPSVYLVASGGTLAVNKAGGNNPALELLAVLGGTPPSKVVVNELTTVASAFTNARFINGGSISGNPLGLRIAAGNVPNLVDPVTGGWGKVLLDPLNSSMTTTMANLDTLGSLITATVTVANDDWRARFFKASTPTGGTTPKNTLEAMAGIAREPWAAPKELYALFDEAYPLPAPDARRSAPFAPYLVYAPDDFALSLSFSGGGDYANGRFMFDAEGNLWSGQNWLPGSQSGVNKSTGGGVVKFTPNGIPLSPPITGFTGMGIDGVGWGTAVTKDRVWISSFNGKILVMDFNGKPVASESDFPFKEKFLGLMGIGVAANGDVWIADGSDNQLLFFPGGRIKDGRIVKVAGLKSPFDIVIDDENRVWVSNSQSDTVVRFPADDPSKVETFRAGIGVRALALDSKGNVWVASNMDLRTSAAEDSRWRVHHGAVQDCHRRQMLKFVTPTSTTGAVNMIRPDGTQPAPMGFTGLAISVPWGLNIDGNDDVWIGNIWASHNAVVLIAGDDTKGHPAGTKAGDVIHMFQSGSIQMFTDVSIDPAGNVWAANNWNFEPAAMADNPARPHLDLGRRFRLHRHLRRGGPGEAAAHRQGATVLTLPPVPIGCGALDPLRRRGMTISCGMAKPVRARRSALPDNRSGRCLGSDAIW